jgi:hypothetical protein
MQPSLSGTAVATLAHAPCPRAPSATESAAAASPHYRRPPRGPLVPESPRALCHLPQGPSSVQLFTRSVTSRPPRLPGRTVVHLSDSTQCQRPTQRREQGAAH